MECVGVYMGSESGLPGAASFQCLSYLPLSQEYQDPTYFKLAGKKNGIMGWVIEQSKHPVFLGQDGRRAEETL